MDDVVRREDADADAEEDCEEDADEHVPAHPWRRSFEDGTHSFPPVIGGGDWNTSSGACATRSALGECMPRRGAWDVHANPEARDAALSAHAIVLVIVVVVLVKPHHPATFGPAGAEIPTHLGDPHLESLAQHHPEHHRFAATD